MSLLLLVVVGTYRIGLNVSFDQIVQDLVWDPGPPPAPPRAPLRPQDSPSVGLS